MNAYLFQGISILMKSNFIRFGNKKTSENFRGLYVEF